MNIFKDKFFWALFIMIAGGLTGGVIGFGLVVTNDKADEAGEIVVELLEVPVTLQDGLGDIVLLRELGDIELPLQVPNKREFLARHPALPELAEEWGEIKIVAHVLCTESDHWYEQYLVGWALRNRRDTGYRGMWSYTSHILADEQFSAFNAEWRKMAAILGLAPDKGSGCDGTEEIAEAVLAAPDDFRPFPPSVRHFYSPVSMSRDAEGYPEVPTWAIGKEPYPVAGIDPFRFKFFAVP